MRTYLPTVLVALFVLGLPIAQATQIYRWNDDQGTIHFTTDPGEIPEEFRDKVKEMLAKTPTTGESEPPSAPTVEASQSSFSVPLKAVGSALKVEAVLNDTVITSFLLDTGSGKTLINPETARRLNLDVGPSNPAIAGYVAGGALVTFPVVYLERFSLGQVALEDLPVLVGGGPQLMGMDVLQQFRYSIDPANTRLVLNLKPETTSGEIRGGHNRLWWKRKFAFLKERIGEEKALEAKLDGQLQALPAGQERLQLLHMRKEVAGRKQTWRGRLRDLELKAAGVLVPFEWRGPP